MKSGNVMYGGHSTKIYRYIVSIQDYWKNNRIPLHLDLIANLKAELPSVSFFGQIEYTEEVLSLLNALSNHIEVYI
jgi:exonuclease V gamma subunit